MKPVAISALIACALVLSACETTTAIPYQPSTQNVITAQRTLKPNATKVTLGAFTASGGTDKPTCRAAGTLDIAPGKSVESYIREAFQTELFTAGGYDEGAGVSITGNLDTLAVDTFGTGKWTLQVTVKSTAYPQGYTVSTVYPFASSFSAVSACQNATTAFNPAVQELLGKIVASPDFAKLTGAAR
jgi:hypothetical protein